MESKNGITMSKIRGRNTENRGRNAEGPDTVALLLIPDTNTSSGQAPVKKYFTGQAEDGKRKTEDGGQVKGAKSAKKM